MADYDFSSTSQAEALEMANALLDKRHKARRSND